MVSTVGFLDCMEIGQVWYFDAYFGPSWIKVTIVIFVEVSFKRNAFPVSSLQPGNTVLGLVGLLSFKKECKKFHKTKCYPCMGFHHHHTKINDFSIPALCGSTTA